MIKNNKKRKTVSNSDDINNFNLWKKRTKTQQKKDEEVLLNSFIRETIDGDGNCLFRAILYSLYQDDSEHMELRLAVCQYMKRDRERWEPLITLTKKINTWDKYMYITNMEEDGTWGELAQVLAAAEIENFNFTIFHPKSISKLAEDNDRENAPMIYLEYFNYNHYNSLLPRQESELTVDISKVKKKVISQKQQIQTKTQKENTEIAETFRQTRSKSVPRNLETKSKGEKKSRQKTTEPKAQVKDTKKIQRSQKSTPKVVEKDGILEATKLSQSGVDSISSKVQNQVIVTRLYESGYDAKGILALNIKGLSRSTVYDQISKLDVHGEIGYKAGPGRKRIIDDEDVLIIVDYLNDNPDASCPDISAHISKLKGIDVQYLLKWLEVF